MTILFDNLSKRDAKLLASWWNANTEGYYFPSYDYSTKRYFVYKQ